MVRLASPRDGCATGQRRWRLVRLRCGSMLLQPAPAPVRMRTGRPVARPCYPGLSHHGLRYRTARLYPGRSGDAASDAGVTLDGDASVAPPRGLAATYPSPPPPRRVQRQAHIPHIRHDNRPPGATPPQPPWLPPPNGLGGEGIVPWPRSLTCRLPAPDRPHLPRPRRSHPGASRRSVSRYSSFPLRVAPALPPRAASRALAPAAKPRSTPLIPHLAFSGGWSGVPRWPGLSSNPFVCAARNDALPGWSDLVPGALEASFKWRIAPALR